MRNPPLLFTLGGTKHNTLMLYDVDPRPVIEEQPIGIQRYTMRPGRNDGSYRLVVERQPTNIADRDLLSLVVDIDACIS